VIGPWIPMTASPEFSQSVMVSEWSESRARRPVPGPGDGYCIGMKYCPVGVGSSGRRCRREVEDLRALSKTCRCMVVRLTTMAYVVVDSVTSLWRTRSLTRWALGQRT